MNKGDYVLATKYSDGDPMDQWAVGFYDRSEQLKRDVRHYVIDEHGEQFRANGFRRCDVISKGTGKWLLENREKIEVFGAPLWDVVSNLVAGGDGYPKTVPKFKKKKGRDYTNILCPKCSKPTYRTERDTLRCDDAGLRDGIHNRKKGMYVTVNDKEIEHHCDCSHCNGYHNDGRCSSFDKPFETADGLWRALESIGKCSERTIQLVIEVVE